MLGKIVSVLMAFTILTGCATKIPLTTQYSGTLEPAPAGVKPVNLDLDLMDHQGGRYGPGSAVHDQYRMIAMDALARSGYTVSASAPITIRVRLEGQTESGIVHNASNVGRNIVVSAVTLGIGCSEMEHLVSADGTVSIRRNDIDLTTVSLPMQHSDTSCHSKVNPNWLRNHTGAGLRTLSKAVSAHVENWLGILAKTLIG